ncbi:MAG: hypothetical protein EPO21_15825 [Chloroflexota bacterium]|nr:MAG: hypothetical protein EPO21_15825 [Chloroflexota bacterium]
MIYRILAEQVVDAPQHVAYQLAADVSRYPEFLSGLEGARVHGDLVEMTARVGPLSLTWTCKATFEPCNTITTTLCQGPFRSLTGRWSFTPHGGKTKVTLELRVEPAVGPRFIERLVAKAMESQVEKSIKAFRKRIDQLREEQIAQPIDGQPQPATA